MKIKSILLSQPKPADVAKTPYEAIIKKFNVNIEFEKFIKLEEVSASDLRQEKVKLNDFTAIILTSRNTIDHFFRIAKEMRYTIPEDLKYFCVSESTAQYLQHYVQYRKRKIFHEHTFAELVGTMKKHKEEKFFLPSSLSRFDIAKSLNQNLSITKHIHKFTNFFCISNRIIKRNPKMMCAQNCKIGVIRNV